MLRVNKSDGSTESFDLEHKDDLSRWRSFRHNTNDITGLTFVVEKQHFTFPFPTKFRSVRLDAKQVMHRNGSGRVIGYAVTVYADEVCAEMLVYTGRRPRMVRFSLERSGKAVYLPELDD